MSLWKVFEGTRYCGGVCEHSLRRYKRIRDNRDKLVELGLMTVDEPLEGYRTEEWEEHTTAYSQYEMLLNRYEDGLIKLEEFVKADPRYPSDSDTDSAPETRNKNVNGESDFAECTDEQKVNQYSVNEEAETPEVEDLEMFLHSELESVPALKDLFVNKNLISHLIDGPVDVCKLIAENPELTHEICEADIDYLMPDEEFYKITCETYPGGWEKFVEDMENGESSDEEIKRIELPPDLYNELISDRSKDVPDDDEERFKFGRINKDQTDTCLDRALELYDNYHNMTHEEYKKKVKNVLKDRDRIIVLDDDGDNTIESTNKSNIPQTKECVRKPESDDNLPSCSGVHHDLEHGQQYHCTATGCLKLFKTQLELERHKCGTTQGVSRKGKEKGHKCDTCGNMFGWRSDLTRHIRTVHDEVARLACPYCQYRTDHQHHLTQHILTHTGDKQYKCTHCDYTTVQKNTLTTHIYHNHTNKTHNCQYHACGVKTSSEQELYDHISSEHALLQYRCDVCPMSFNKPDVLKKHKLTHGDDEFKCRYCGRRFVRADTLKEHILMHTGERAHKCDVCGKRFTRNSNLAVHMRVHTGAKPYSCTHCGMEFNVSNAKNRHESSCKYK